MRRNAFGELHPAASCGFFTAAIVLTVVVQDPVWTGASVVAAGLFTGLARGRAALSLLSGMGVAFVALSLINGLLNAQGATVLFAFPGGRPCTLEALLFGMQTAAMFVAVMLWFGCMAWVLPAGRALFLFKGAAPAIALVMAMVLRLVPAYARRARRIADARAGIGLSVRAGGIRARARSGLAVMDALASWALESVVVTADSMRSRGYGSGPRTCIAPFRFRKRDGAFLVVGAFLLVVAACGIAGGCAVAQFVPRVQLSAPSPLGAASLSAFVGLLLLPSVVHLAGRVPWRCSISKA